MKWKLKRVQCLTDSKLLAEALAPEFRLPLFVVPIPHTDHRPTRIKKEHKETLFWWPGGLIREDKGLRTIQKLLQLMEGKEGMCIVMADAAREKFGNIPHLRLIPTHLSREEYMAWMQKADLILLPYSCDYAKRTSGIFVEAIMVGAIPAVTRGTWMAHELSKFDLAELTFDWSEQNLLDRLTALPRDQNILAKLKMMRLHYHNFHTPEIFAATCEEIAREPSLNENACS